MNVANCKTLPETNQKRHRYSNKLMNFPALRWSAQLRTLPVAGEPNPLSNFSVGRPTNFTSLYLLRHSIQDKMGIIECKSCRCGGYNKVTGPRNKIALISPPPPPCLLTRSHQQQLTTTACCPLYNVISAAVCFLRLLQFNDLIICRYFVFRSITCQHSIPRWYIFMRCVIIIHAPGGSKRRRKTFKLISPVSKWPKELLPAAYNTRVEISIGQCFIGIALGQ